MTMATLDLTTAELDLLLNALQTWKTHTERHLSERDAQGWDSTEQLARIQAIDELQERLFAMTNPQGAS